MTKPGIWKHYKGGLYRVLFNARQETNGNPDNGKLVVVYLDLKYGGLHVRDEEQFHQRVWKEDGRPVDQEFIKPFLETGDNAAKIEAGTVDRFSFCGTMANEMSDTDAAELYDGLHETFTGRKPAP